MMLCLQSAESCGCAASKPVNFESHALGERNKEVGERRVLLGIVGHIGAVPVAAACEDDGHRSGRISIGSRRPLVAVRHVMRRYGMRRNGI